MTKHKRVAVLRGGPSTEYDISLQTGAGVLTTLRSLGYFAKDVVIDRQGNWLVDGYFRRPEHILSDIDVVFIALHGVYGEDGTVQRLLHRLRLPYTGSGPYASAIAMNKHLTKEHLKELGIVMPRHMRLTRAGVSDVTKSALSIGQLFGPQYVVKPINGGSSVDTIMVANPSQLAGAIGTLLSDYEEILIEECIRGKEATVGILEDFRNERHYVLPEVEIVPPPEAGFFNREVKYNGATQEIVPGRFSKTEKQKLREIALAVHQALNLSQYSRSDFVVTADNIYFLEVNTLPGLTSESLFPRAMSAIGSDYRALVEHLVETAKV